MAASRQNTVFEIDEDDDNDDELNKLNKKKQLILVIF